MAIQFILDYMDFAFWDWEASLAYDAHLIPVFDNEFQKNCRQDSCWLVQNFTVLEDSVWKIERFMDDNAYWSVIEKKVQPNLYLNNTFL